MHFIFVSACNIIALNIRTEMPMSEQVNINKNQILTGDTLCLGLCAVLYRARFSNFRINTVNNFAIVVFIVVIICVSTVY